MAITSDGWKGTVTLVDNGADVSTLRYDLVAADAADAAAAMADVIAALDAVTDAVIGSWSVGEHYSEKSLSLPANGVQVQNQAIVSVQIYGNPVKRAQFRIPAPVVGIFGGSSGEAADTIDPGDADLQTYGALFGNGGVATISDGETIAGISTATARGHRMHRASNKG